MNLLTVENLHARYGSAEVLHGIDFEVPAGEVTVVLGANGAGKTTILRSICQLVRTSGQIVFDGRDITGMRTDRIARLGVAHVPQGRGTFADLTVEENLRVGGYTTTAATTARAIERWFDFFPRLRERRRQQAGGLSGGEQQMLAIARALVAGPRLLLLDEPSLGLAPRITQEVFRALDKISGETETTILVVEQNAHLALDIGTSAVLVDAGRVVAQRPAAGLAHDESVRRAYLGY
ncbi:MULTISPECIES: ABC transporter ATP-binding protein [unclassified Rhodococcus (in: high G+C Gram-positive bacteria)]|uniref:ABC transporter ATP-binding protein n=1 Tax=unclassified Rhodococcus (in: high G+C Gram-positive bacteria) TaxID=192944 RepID=UPI00163989EB|nr:MULTISPECIES: ABC transporter ATP-binding protein [unclassified Rhodococcus (in: high G+C Gram-positive bacteria)]MBC2643747.1 ABC transporter ATP-binding protein [Rhodococcus sp. 3A]MBC2891512.1 ABC transporter ATP-binding protein [Rhodococcus sp. 4CII]